MTKTFINSANSVQGNESVLKEMVIDNNTFNNQDPFTEEDSKYIQDLLEALGTNNTDLILKQITISDTDSPGYTNYLFTFEVPGPIIPTGFGLVLPYRSRINKFMDRYNNYTENAGSYHIVRIYGTNTFQAFYQIG